MKSQSTSYGRWLALCLNLAVIILELVGFLQTVSIHGFTMLQFYTEDSNLFALFASIVLVVVLLTTGKNKPVPSWVGTLKYMSVCCLSVTFLVVITILAPMYGGLKGYNLMLLQGSTLYHHFLCPVLSIISFLFFDPIAPIRKKGLLISMIPTVLYAIVMLILNILKLVYGPYPFLHVYEQPVYLSCIWFVLILGMAFLLSWLLQIGQKHLHPSQKKPA